MRILTCCLPVLGLLLVASCGGWGDNSPPTGEIQDSMQSKTLNRIGSEAGLVMPVGSEVTHFSEPPVLFDPMWVARIVVPASSYEGFRESLLGKAPKNGLMQGRLSESTRWRKPTHVMLTRQYQINGHPIVYVVVSKEGEEVAVYIEYTYF